MRARLLVVPVAALLVFAVTAVVLPSPAAPSRSATTSSGSSSTSRDSKALEPVALHRVPLPPDVLGMSEANFATDGEHLVAAFVKRQEGSRPPGQLAVMDPETGAVDCLTCGVPIPGVEESERPNIGKPQVLSDGRRVLFRSGARPDSESSNPLDLFTGDAEMFQYYMLECQPSVVQCDDAAIVKIALPSEGLGSLTQNREARISPDNEWFAWTEVRTDGTRMTMGRLQRETDRYVLRDLLVINPRFTLRGGRSDDWRKAMPLYEFKNFADGGRTAYYASFHDAQNYDVFKVDLASGRHRRVTTDIEWNEGTVTSPDGSSFVNGSSRGRSRMAPFALVPRPPFVDFGVYVLTGRYSLGGGNRRCLLEPWLLSSKGQQGEYFGQPINPTKPVSWGSHGPGSWSPDGTRYAFWERNYERGPDVESRLVVATLPAREPSPAPRPPSTPRPSWATPRKDWNGALDKIGTFVIQGKHSGRAVLTLSGLNPNSTIASVTYRNYSDDGENILDGHETSLNPFALLTGSWSADLTVTGKHRGSLRAEVVSTKKGLRGRVRSVYDGRVASGLPNENCQPASLPRPRLRLERLHRKGSDDLVLRVTSRPVSDDTARPVRSARVTVGRHVLVSNERGIVRLPGTDRKREVTARAPGFVSVTRTYRG